jgi:hypothetical protein
MGADMGRGFYTRMCENDFWENLDFGITVSWLVFGLSGIMGCVHGGITQTYNHALQNEKGWIGRQKYLRKIYENLIPF